MKKNQNKEIHVGHTWASQAVLTQLPVFSLPPRSVKKLFSPPAPSLYHGHHEKSPPRLFYTSPSLKKKISLASHYRLCCSPISKHGLLNNQHGRPCLLPCPRVQCSSFMAEKGSPSLQKKSPEWSLKPTGKTLSLLRGLQVHTSLTI